MKGHIEEKKELFNTMIGDLEDLSAYIDDLKNGIPHPIFVVNHAGILIDTNKALEQLTGWSIEELLGKNHHAIFADKLTIEEIRSQTIEKGSVSEKEVALLTRHGDQLPMSIYTHMREDNLGNASYVATLIDISGRKQAEEEAKRSTEKLLNAMENTIQAMAMIVEMRDPYTAGHQRRVTQLACAIAQEIGLSDDQINALRLAGLIHDIGKIRVPAEILTNPDGLSEAEFGMIKMHPVVGYDVLKTMEFPWPIAQIVHQHHERMDGSGYPSGLLGESIVLEARILAVADVVEAISSHRPYRPAYGIDMALDEISKKRGILYDAEIVDACLRLFREKGFRFK